MKEAFRYRIRQTPLISAAAIATRVAMIGRRISEDYRTREVAMLVTLKGAFVFASDLARHVSEDVNIHIDFIRARSYRNSVVSSGKVELSDLQLDNIEGRDVIVVEDIIDTSRTIRALRDRLSRMRVPSLEIATLLVKDHGTIAEIQPRYCGFHIPDVFVVGYGLDYAERYRHLPAIHVLETE